MKTYQVLLTLVLCLPFVIHANNIMVSNATVNGRNTTTKTANVQFNLSWENSWRHNGSSGGLSYIGVKTGGTGYTGAPKVYIGSQGSVAWQASASVSAGDLLVVSATPDRYYVATTSHTTLSTAPTHTSGTLNNLLFVSVRDGGGSGATATASVSGGIITSYTITAAGSGYTTVPSVTIAPTNGGSGATADAYIQSWWDAAWVFVKFRVGESDPTFSGVSSSGTTVTVNSTANLRVGMPVVVTSGTGAFAANTVISSITNTTQFVVSATPSTGLSNATMVCGRIWEHAALDTTDANHTAPSGSTINAPNDSTGVFIYRSSAGSGTNTWNNAGLRWKYGSNGLADDTYIEVKVFAIEMVYVPGGVDFNVGGGGGSSAFTSTTINTAVANTVPSGSGSMGGQAGGYPTGQTAPNANWPNGFKAFYCMKYEMTQGQYRDFLNTLTYAQQVNRAATAPNSVTGTGGLSSTNANRNGIDLQTPGNATTLIPALYGCNLNGNNVYNEADDGEWIACNFLNWMDGCAYLDWSGLRPMTELEYEKTCRGNLAAVSGEYAWGGTSITQTTGISNGGAMNETFSNSGANCAYGNDASVQGPLRVGAFSGAATTRTQAGATYYGIMEMSGNLWERTVTIGNPAGGSYTGLHGDGQLFHEGTANVDFWPGINGNSNTALGTTAFGGTTGVTEAAGSGFRGGDWMGAASIVFASGRNAGAAADTSRGGLGGFRGVRSAP